MKNARLVTILLATAALGVTGCASAGASPSASNAPSDAVSPTPTAIPSPSPSETEAPTMEPSFAAAEPPSGIPERVWEALLTDLSRRIGEPVTDPEVMEAESRTWNDGSLGCPQPGEMYTQALVDGYQIVVAVDGDEYDYRSDGRGVRLCEEGSPREGEGG